MPFIILIASEAFLVVLLHMALTKRRLPTRMGGSLELGKNPVLFIAVVTMLVIATLFVTSALIVVVFRNLSVVNLPQ